jgi:hypothetical protein
VSLWAAAVALAVGAAPVSYSDLLREYAAGDRAAAVAELAAFDDGPIARELDALHDRAGARCSSCDPAAIQSALRAAVMLHTDKDELDRRPLATSGDYTPTCGPPVHALFAERALGGLLADAQGREFARRWYVAMALRKPRRPVLRGRPALGHGRAQALRQGQGAAAGTRPARRGDRHDHAAARARRRERHAARDRPAARAAGRGPLAADGGRRLVPAGARRGSGRAEASLHLGRVRFRLGQPDAALSALAPVLARSREPSWLYLASLFAGRVHEASGRARDAERAYENAAKADPEGQAAAMALAHVRLMAGETGETRAILDKELGRTVPRTHADPFWNYQVGAARRAEPLFEALRDEVTTPMRTALVLVVAAAASAPAVAQQSPPLRFDTGIEAVYVDAFVTKDGQPVTGLTASAFELRDGNVTRRSSSSRSRRSRSPRSWPSTRAAASRARSSWRCGGRARRSSTASGRGRDRRRRLLPRGPLAGAPTHDRDEVRRALADVPRARRDLALGRPPRRARPAAAAGALARRRLHGRRGQHELARRGQVKAAAQRSNAVIHAVGLRPGGAGSVAAGPHARPEHAARARAGARAAPDGRDDGGRFWTAESPDRLRQAFAAIVAAMNSRYVLRFEPRPGSAPGWHRSSCGSRGQGRPARSRRLLPPRGVPTL